MKFFIDLKLFPSTRLWRYTESLESSVGKGIIDDSNLKIKVTYLKTSDILVVLTKGVGRFGGVIVRQGFSSDRYYLIFSTENALNNFVSTYAVLLRSIPVLVVNAIRNQNRLYRLTDYLLLVERNPVILLTTASKLFCRLLQANLGQRCSQMNSFQLFFFNRFQSLLAYKFLMN
jgi:hypothetical protein